MSAFGGGGAFNFGASSNNNNTGGTGGFGGFGANNNTNNTGTGFGATTNTGFGNTTAASNPFGASTTSTFGSGAGGAFGANNNAGTSLFGNKPASSPFGASTTNTSGGLFGSTNNNTTANTGTGFGGFGASTTTNTNPGFSGTANNGGGFAFGQNNTNTTTNNNPFGASTQAKPSLFGAGGNGTTGAFGSTGGFGAGAGSALNQPVPPSDGTATTPFAPTIEKEANNTTSSYQSIVFQPPYQKYSFEELRLADYNAGRRFGNGSGQAGAFGSTTFGGGFGAANNNTNPFGGSTTTTSGGFGNNNATAGGFGGGLFGNNNSQNKPTGLFGAQTSTTGTTGGLFGTSNTTTPAVGGFGGGFGSTNNNTAAGGGLFGNNTSTQNKPGGLFGNTGASTGGGLFGQNNQSNTNTGGGLFGNNNTAGTTPGGGLFGANNNNQQANTGGGLFGNNNQASGGSLFGNNKPTGFGTAATTPAQPSGGLFGGNNAANTGTSLFGNNTQQNNTGGGLFGNNNANTGGGLFGNNQQQQNKPGGLFGNTNTNTGGSLFGNASTVANAGSSLFGSNNTTQQASGGLFGNNNNNAGGGLFGSNQQQAKPGGLFGNSTNNNNQGGGLFGNNSGTSLFGNSQSNQQPNNQQQQQQVKHASLLDPNPYGQSSIWTGLPAPTPENAKPVFTPLSATQKMKESMMKPPPSLRLNQSRYMTPPRRNGFGFSYSTYGTPNSAASTPGGAGLSGSMYGSRGFSGGSFGRSFNKSVSVQNLRSQFTSDGEDLWKPGAFASTHRNSGGSIKRLTIDRNIRQDLFSPRTSQPALPAPPKPAPTTAASVASEPVQVNNEPPQESSAKLKKRVSFDKDVQNGLNSQSGALVRTEIDEDEPEESSRVRPNRPATNGERKELDAVPEDRASNHVTNRAATVSNVPVQAKTDPKPGDYWMKPSRAEMSKMPREKLTRYKDFQVGRVGCGQVTFNGTVDLAAIPLDDLYDKIVEIRLRSITVYPDASTKPPVGRGLNVPSTISIENSWPRSRNQPSSATSGPVFDKHINRLKQISGTEFVEYEVSTGVWTFKVPHYTRYGLDYDDEDEDMEEDVMSSPPDNIEKAADVSVMEVDDEDDIDEDHDDENDTFAFKKTVPGGFGRQSVVDNEPDLSVVQTVEEDGASDHSNYSEEEMSEDERAMPGSLPAAPEAMFQSPVKSTLKQSRMNTPGKPLLDLEGDWAEQLQRTISPRKQNRETLREVQSRVLLDRAYQPMQPKSVRTQRTFRTSIDVMNSLFSQDDERRSRVKKTAKAAGPDFEYPYAKRAKVFNPEDEEMTEDNQLWHASYKPHFTTTGGLLLREQGGQIDKDSKWQNKVLTRDDQHSIILSRIASEKPVDMTFTPATCEIVVSDDVPFVQHRKLPFSYLVGRLQDADAVETNIYALAHVLFDEYEDDFTLDLPLHLRKQYESRIRKDRLTKFLSSYILEKHSERIRSTEKENPTTAALLRLTAHDIKGACDLLMKVKNNRLTLLVSQIDGQDDAFMEDIKAQIDAWRAQNLLSEMTEQVRALYEICSGNVTVSQGKSQSSIPAEDKAKTFSISETFGLDWVQCFALGLWYGKDEKMNQSGVATIEDAVREFSARCDRSEFVGDSQPHQDAMWSLLRLYASTNGEKHVSAPSFPDDLGGLIKTWDSSAAFRLQQSLVANVEECKVDKMKAAALTESLAYEISARGDLPGAVYVLLHLSEAQVRKSYVKDLLVRSAASLPEPSSTGDGAPPSDSTWHMLTTQLKLPQAWIFTAKAMYARAAKGDSFAELRFLVAAESWDEAHECFIKRVAPGLVVDEDWQILNEVVATFGADIETKVSKWDNQGGVYTDFATAVSTKSPDEKLVESLRRRIVDLGRSFNSDVDLGKLSLEDLEERVAVKEMARFIAGISAANKKDILDLPLTADQRLSQTIAMAGDYYHGVMENGTTGRA